MHFLLGGKVIDVLLAVDERMIRGALYALLRLEDDIKVIAEEGRAHELQSAVEFHEPDVLVLGMQRTGEEELALAERIHQGRTATRTLLLTSDWRPSAVRKALDVGVGAVLSKGSPPEQLADTIRGLAAGRRVIDAELAQSVWRASASPLTARELDVLRRAATGEDVLDIAAELHLSPGTIRNYLTNVTRKLNARTRVDAVRIAECSGWL
ncbi:response regulator transcription factor [Streptomyces sp. 891-h]|uniref:response regulator transcription factor n=1 Tax=Streptomyces sp. 891-h TaxID=2720714 RepID=UPI00325BE407